MALSEDDLRFKLAVDVDKSAVKEATGLFDDIISKMEKASKSLSDVAASLTAGTGKSSVGKVHTEILKALDARTKSEKAIDDILESQAEKVERIRMAMSPEYFEQRMRMEKEVADALERQEKAESEWKKAHDSDSTLSVIMKTIKERMFGGIMGGGSFLGASGTAGVALSIIPKVGALLGQVTAPLQGFANVLSDMQGPLGPIGAGLRMVAAPLKAVSSLISSIPVIGELLGPFTAALAGIPGMLGDITSSFINMAAKASPGQMKLFQLALDDTQAVIGRSFIPVLQMLTEMVRFAGDMLASMLPSMGEMQVILRPMRLLWKDVRDAVADAMTVVGPLIKQVLILGIMEFTFVLKALWAVLKPIITFIKMFAAVMGIKPEVMKSSQGAAARPASISGLSEYGESLALAAFSQGVNYEKEQAELLKDIAGDTEKISGRLDKRGEEVTPVGGGTSDFAAAKQAFAYNQGSFFKTILAALAAPAIAASSEYVGSGRSSQSTPRDARDAASRAVEDSVDKTEKMGRPQFSPGF